MIRIGGEHRHVTHLARVLDAYEVDRVEQPALLRDRCGDLRERPWPVLERDANRGAEGSREVLGVSRVLADGGHGHSVFEHGLRAIRGGTERQYVPVRRLKLHVLWRLRPEL